MVLYLSVDSRDPGAKFHANFILHVNSIGSQVVASGTSNDFNKMSRNNTFLILLRYLTNVSNNEIPKFLVLIQTKLIQKGIALK